MTIHELRERKIALGYTNEMIARLSGVPLGTVQKIFAGITKAPRRETLLALENILAGEGPSGISSAGSTCAKRQCSGIQAVRGPSAACGAAARSGNGFPDDRCRGSGHTIADCYSLPDEPRAELIDGEFFMMEAPSVKHQIVLRELAWQLYPWVEEHDSCELFFAPFDVRLDNDDYTMVQPDLLITCRNNFDVRRMNGAPDLAMEVISPASRTKDMFRKLGKYCGAGVREYWIVDPEREKVVVYDLEHDGIPETWTFQDTVPVGISDGKCLVDFSRIRKKLERLQL